jgi:DNA-binding SARP family transcriptional activator/streptogramin lyase
MEFRILGPLEVVDDEGRTVPLGGARQRALLAALLLRANEVVLLDQLMEDVWGGRLPTTGSKAVQVAVSQLRKTLGNGMLETQPAGYLLRVANDQLDLGRFEALRDRARAALAAGRAEEAASILRDALALWRGPALGDIAYESFARAEAERLEQLRLVARDERIEADLTLGRHAELIPELEAQIARHPLRERPREHLMLALYRSGRQADALEVYRETRRKLADELGIEPSPRLQELERAILRQEPELEPEAAAPAAPPPARRRRRRRLPLVLAAALVLAVAAALGVTLTRDGRAPVDVAPNTVAVIDPAEGEIVAAVPVGDSPGPIVAGLGAVWVLNRNDATISKLDPARLKPQDVIAGVAELRGGRESTAVALLAAGEGALWTGHAGTLRRSEPDRLAAPIVIDTDAVGFWTEIATGLGKVWLAGTERRSRRPSLMRIHPDRASIEQIVRLAAPGDYEWARVAVGSSFVWVAVDGTRILYRYDPVAREMASVPLEASPSAIAVGTDAVWVTDVGSDRLLRVDPQTLELEEPIAVGDGPIGVAVGAGAVWTANASDGTVSRVDPATGEVTTIEVGHRPQGVALANGRVWVSVRS